MRYAIALVAAITAGCAVHQPTVLRSLAEGRYYGHEQIEAERNDAYTRLMRFQNWVMGLMRFQW